MGATALCWTAGQRTGVLVKNLGFCLCISLLNLLQVKKEVLVKLGLSITPGMHVGFSCFHSFNLIVLRLLIYLFIYKQINLQGRPKTIS